MPYDRWFDTTAEGIADKVPMFPILDAENNGMSQAIQYLMGKNIEGYPVSF